MGHTPCSCRPPTSLRLNLAVVPDLETRVCVPLRAQAPRGGRRSLPAECSASWRFVCQAELETQSTTLLLLLCTALANVVIQKNVRAPSIKGTAHSFVRFLRSAHLQSKYSRLKDNGSEAASLKKEATRSISRAGLKQGKN